MESITDYPQARTIGQILTLYYLEDLNQAEIAARLGLSTAKVNRLLKQARQDGLVQIVLHSPFQSVFAMESELEQRAGLKKAIVTPASSGAPLLGQAAASYLRQQARPGQTICLGGGSAVREMVDCLADGPAVPELTIVPALGGVQGRYETDVNNLAARLAARFEGLAYQLHAPALTDSSSERQNLIELRQVREVLESARRAQIAVVGIGAVRAESASFFRLTALGAAESRQLMDDPRAHGELLAHVIDAAGRPLWPKYEQRVVGLTLDELRAVPLVIGVAAGPAKVEPIAAALRGGYLHTLITDEPTAREVLDLLNPGGPAANPHTDTKENR